MKKKPRDYQIEALELIWEKLMTTRDNLLCISPTGTGKTFIINALTKRLVREKKVKTMVITHNKDIIGQNADSMLDFWPIADVGIYSAGLKRRDTDNKIVYAGIQSIHKRGEEFGKVAIIIIDEAHLLSPNDGTMYRRFIEQMQKQYKHVRLLLFSATPYRLGQGHLLESDMVDSIAFDFTETEKFMWFVEQGYLTKLVTKKAAKEFDITEARIRGGEFNDTDMQKISNTKENNIAVVQECMRYGLDRNHWMIFASGIEHGNALTEQFEAHGIKAVCLHADSPDRDNELKKWENGEYRAMINVGLYTTGYDFPPLDLIAVARATQSTSLWVQICGRGTRCVYKGDHDLSTPEGRLAAIEAGPKQDCLVLDFAGNTRRLGPINAPIIPKPRRKGDDNEGEAPVKVCPECESYNHTRAAECTECGYEFPPPEAVQTEAGTDDIMVSEALEPDDTDFSVVSVVYREGVSTKSGNSYLKVTYNTFADKFHSYLHPGSRVDFLRQQFEDWWWYHLSDEDKRLHKGKRNYDFPQSIDEALEREEAELREPSIVTVDMNSKHKNVLGVSFDETTEDEPF